MHQVSCPLQDLQNFQPMGLPNLSNASLRLVKSGLFLVNNDTRTANLSSASATSEIFFFVGPYATLSKHED